jgi:3-phenylpropionate/trans-cinnamate dioxygenase ferredoxin subunit
MERFITVARVADVKPGKAKSVHIAGNRIGLFNAGGAFYAIQNECTADGGPLSEGLLTGTMIECPCDSATFYLPTGESVHPLGLKVLVTYEVRVDGDKIQLELADASQVAYRRREYTQLLLDATGGNERTSYQSQENEESEHSRAEAWTKAI